jgi:hypothetical protein
LILAEFISLHKELLMVRRVIKWMFLLVPILLWLSLVGSCIYKQHRTDQLMKEADGLVWGDGSDRLIVHVNKERIGEEYHYLIQIMKPDGKVSHESEMVIDHDMWGGGLVKAINADEDAGLEVVAWGAHEAKTSFYLDYSRGIVQRKSFSQASTEMKTLVREWYEAHVTDSAGIFFLFFPLVGYYFLFGLISLVVRLLRRKKSESTAKSRS